ncbi:MAG: glycosyltransferase [Defluviitaleaceae bacterium]|nr:glycosyltransferase [Defluviitaleaceae bacterium]
MDLSIGMIMKNEEKYLRDCLNGIKPILDQVHSELIIYDTGSTDASVEIAREFTDKVYSIEWRGDFAWARNHTIDKANGKWYMFLDADEIFNDVEDIISFFNSGEYKKYKSATYRLVNKLSDTISADFNPRRMFKKEKGTRFAGKIHEYIAPKAPIKGLKSTAIHYGYYFTGPNAAEERKIKRERNLASLLELYEQNPKDTRTLLHLSNEYYNSDKENTLRYINEGLDVVKDNQKHIYYHVFTTQLANHYSINNEWESVIKTVQNYFNNLEEEHLNIIQLRATEALALHSVQKYKEAAQAYEQSFDCYKKYKEGKINNDITTILPISTSLLESEAIYISGIVSNYIYAGELDKGFDLYEQYKEGPGIDPNVNIIKKYVSINIQTKNWDAFANLIAYGLRQGQNSDKYNGAIDEIEKSLKNEQTKENIASAILNDATIGDLDIDYIWLQKLRMGQSEALDYFLESDKPFSRHYGDVLVAAMKRGADITRFLSNMEINDTLAFINQLHASNKGLYEVISSYIQTINRQASTPGIKTMRILSEVAHAAFLSSVKNNSLAAVLRINTFESAVRIRHKYLGSVYREDIYNADAIEALPDRDRVTFYAGTAYICRDKGDIIEGFIKNMDRVITIEPDLKPIVKLVAANMMVQEPTPASAVNQEATDEIASLKEAIYTLIDKGDRLKAAQILKSYAQINPTDPEIKTIQEKIMGRL